MKKYLRISELELPTKLMACLILFLNLFAMPASANGPFDFGKKGSKWYYENNGKDTATIKHIYIVSVIL